ncbi:related to amino acid transporters [Phialocephala subalpina]|uniref:Related to amino acid transporters n=1 Tax=Phialocephala subalpina TaxID=576137 RepID=A0A1L7WSS7_9HELO|nr:related to amino acid transporters [Phialocephala subalpina]
MATNDLFGKGPVEGSEPVVSSEAESMDVVDMNAGSQHLRRTLRGKEVQLFAIGGAIGTGVFINMANGLTKGGPGSLLIGFLIWASFMWAVNECFAEMVCYMPVPAPFVRFGGEWVDEALGFAMGWNFYLNMAFLVPFEIVAMSVLIRFWSDAVPVWAVIVVMIVLYALLNTISVRYFGISEFYFSIFKVFLIFGCFAYTFVTMSQSLVKCLGVNLIEGAFAEEHLVKGNSGRLCGLVSCLIQATFAICGPEYISSVAAETENPRKILPKAFLFSGAISGKGTGAASPYVISMERLQISGLASLVNAMIMTSVFSSGNGLLFSATRTLHGMALKGEAPRFLAKCTKAGVPIYALCATLFWCLLSFLQLGNSSATVLIWLADLVTACQLLNYGATAVVYSYFYASIQAKGIDRNALPYTFQPYTSYFAMAGTTVILLLQGYDLFVAEGWSIEYFFLDYTMIGFFILCFVFWKVVKRTKYVRPGTADIYLGGTKKEIDLYESLYTPRVETKLGAWFNRFFD